MADAQTKPGSPTPSAVDWLMSLSRFGIRPGLARTKRVLQDFGHPEAGLRFYHVAGTNGKGSTCMFLAALLQTRQTVGVFTSPAFDGYRGRFTIQGEPISDRDFVSLAEQVRAAVDRVCAADPLTEFEVLTVMAILYFAQNGVEAVVWETGLGGRYDSTNVVTPVVAAITNVSYDHMEILGDTIRQIAWDKAGIIKPGVPVVTAATDTAYLVIQTVAGEQKAHLYRLGNQFYGASANPEGLGQRMNYRGLHRDLYGVSIPLWGRHQYENASVALAMYEVACSLGHCASVNDNEIRVAFEQVRWPGRFEVLGSASCPIILDGAHNPDGASKFAQTLAEYSKHHGLPAKDWTMVIGVLADKAVISMLTLVLAQAGRVIATEPASKRAKPGSDLAKDITAVRPQLPLQTELSVRDAVREARLIGKPVACWGSLYTVDEARKAIQERPDEFAR